MTFLRSAITYALFPISFAAAMIAGLCGLARGLEHGAMLAGITFATIVIVAIAERINPQYARWNVARNDIATDLMHSLVSQIILPKVLELGLRIVMLAGAARLTQWLGFTVWPTRWPLLAQLALALLLSQFLEYWLHRMMHERPLLWRLHATHHSPARLYWLNAGRFHPLDTAASFTVSMTPLLLLGASADVMLMLTVWIAVHGLFQHANIKVRLGPLNYLFSMAELHRWHHSLRLEEANRNYGNNIIIWDLVFGTFFHPSDREAEEAVGISDLDAFPARYVGQLLSPWRWPSIEEASRSVAEKPRGSDAPFPREPDPGP